MPRVSDSAVFSAACRQMLHRRKSASPSFHSPLWRSKVRSVEATVKLATAAPDGVNRSSGSAVRFPITVIIVSPAISALPRIPPQHLGAQDGLAERELPVELGHGSGGTGHVDYRVNSLGALVDLVGQPALAPDLDLVDAATLRLHHAKELVQRWCHGALVKLWIEDDHHLVTTHEDHSPPVDCRPRTLRGRRKPAEPASMPAEPAKSHFWPRDEQWHGNAVQD